MTEKTAGKKGILIFVILILLCIVIGLAAYLISGNKGIEERFSQAVGLSGGPHDGGEQGGLFGFTIEGNVIVYVAILVLLIAACVILLKKFKL